MNAQLLIIGAGINGLALAVHAARRGMDVLALESGPLGGERSTQRSGALVRTHYADLGSAELAWDGLRRFERFEEIYGASAGFTRTGFVYVPQDGEDLADRVEHLQRIGIDTRLLDRGELAAIDPAIALTDVDHVAYEPRSGYASPAQTCAALAGAARRAGARIEDHRAVARLTADGARLADGTPVHAEQTVLAAGAASAALAATAGVELAISPTAVKLVVFERPSETHLTVIDAPNGTYLRPDGPCATLVGRRTWTDEPLDDASSPLPAVDDAFVDDTRERLARRLPAMAHAAVRSTRTGLLDMTPDGLPLVGPTSREGLWLSCGWSGTGFKTAPAAGDALARWLAGQARPSALAAFDPRRELIAPAGAVRSPH